MRGRICFRWARCFMKWPPASRRFPARLPVLVIDAILNRPPAPISDNRIRLFLARLAAIISKSLQKDREQPLPERL